MLDATNLSLALAVKGRATWTVAPGKPAPELETLPLSRNSRIIFREYQQESTVHRYQLQHHVTLDHMILPNILSPYISPHHTHSSHAPYDEAPSLNIIKVHITAQAGSSKLRPPLENLPCCPSASRSTRAVEAEGEMALDARRQGGREAAAV